MTQQARVALHLTLGLISFWLVFSLGVWFARVASGLPTVSNNEGIVMAVLAITSYAYLVGKASTTGAL